MATGKIDSKLKEQIHLEYISSDASIRDLAAKHGVGKSTIFQWSTQEAWGVEKEAYLKKAAQKAYGQYRADIEQIADNASTGIYRMLGVADKLVDKMEALIELPGDALSPRDIQSLTSAMLNLATLHNLGKDDSKADSGYTISIEGGEDYSG